MRAWPAALGYRRRALALTPAAPASLQRGYPGGIFAPFVPGNLEELKVKELKNGERWRECVLPFLGRRAGGRAACAEGAAR